jgi:hypothetical protein
MSPADVMTGMPGSTSPVPRSMRRRTTRNAGDSEAAITRAPMVSAGISRLSMATSSSASTSKALRAIVASSRRRRSFSRRSSRFSSSTSTRAM